MNNKPVAWMNPSQVVHGFIDARTYWLEGFIPLYTHPVKELTDEEIKELWKPMPDTKTYDSDILNFARAILRKASE